MKERVLKRVLERERVVEREMEWLRERDRV